MAESKKKNKYLSILIRFLIAAGALYLAFRKVEWAEVGRLLMGPKMIWAAACALGLYMASQLIFVARWWLLLRVQSVKIAYWPAVRLHFLGLLYNNALPSSVGGDVLRAWYVTKHTDRKVEAATSVIVDRAVGVLGLLLMAAGGYLFIPEASRAEMLQKYAEIPIIRAVLTHKWTALTLFSAAMAIAVALIVTRQGRQGIHYAVSRVSHRASPALSKMRQAVQIYYYRKLAILAALLLTFACQGVFIAGLWLIGEVMGAAADGKCYFVFFPVSWLLGTIPITPGGLGVVEWAVKTMFKAAGVAENHAAALALAQRALWIFGSLPGVVIHLIGAHLPQEAKSGPADAEGKEFFIDYKSPVN